MKIRCLCTHKVTVFRPWPKVKNVVMFSHYFNDEEASRKLFKLSYSQALRHRRDFLKVVILKHRKSINSSHKNFGYRILDTQIPIDILKEKEIERVM